MSDQQPIKVEAQNGRVYVTIKGKWIALSVDEATELFTQLSVSLKVEQNRTQD